MAAETRTDRALTLARRIEAARSEVDKAQRKLDALVAEFEAVLGSESRAEDESGEQQGSRAGQIVALLNGSPHVWTIVEIAAALKIDNIASLRATLNRLVGAGRIGRSARGEFQAAEDPEYLPQPRNR